ncbi:MAG: extracellular solute-binding protein [Acidobacteriota bacterium]|nr:extracellular solute-binding protein [Acidobacteriota bacterium]
MLISKLRSGLALVAACALVAGLALSVVSNAGASSPVVVTWWTSSNIPSEIDTIDMAFDKAYPGYQANGVYIAQSDNYLPKVISAIKTGTQPTVLFDQSPSDLPLLAQSGKLISLNGKLTQLTNSLYPGIRNSLFYRGKQLGMALGGVGDIALFYNKKEFAAAGITKPPATWTQLAADAAKLTTSNGKQYGFYVPTGDAEWISYDWEPVLYGDGGSLVNGKQTKATFNSMAGVNALNTWVDLVKKGYAPKQSFAAGGNYDGPTAFSSGTVAMITDGQWLEGEVPKGFSYGVAPYPAGSAGQSSSIGIGVVALLKTASAADKGGLDLIKFLASPKEGAYLTKESGGLPSAPAQLSQPLLKSTKKPPFYSVFAADEKYGKVRPITPAYNALSEDLWTGINAAIAGKQSAAAALNAAAQRADSALKAQH